MKEEERLIIKEKVIEDLQKIKLLIEQEKQVEELEKDEKIKQYLNLKKDIIDTKKDLGLNFDYTFYSERLATSFFEREYKKSCYYDKISPCEHELYFYLGSYFAFGHNLECKCDNEDDVVFDYNKYQCVECEKIIKVSKTDYKKFEQMHTVLKPKDGISYQSEYFDLLMDNTVDETKKILVNKYGLKR